MTNKGLLENRLFKDPFFDNWYFWDDSWVVVHGPYAEYVEAHAAMSKHIEEAREEKQSSCPPNCS